MSTYFLEDNACYLFIFILLFILFFSCVSSLIAQRFWTAVTFMCNVLQLNLPWETTAMRDHLSWQTTNLCQKDLHFNITEPVTRDHLSSQTTFFWPMGRSFKTGYTVYCKSLCISIYLYMKMKNYLSICCLAQVTLRHWGLTISPSVINRL